MLKVTKKAIDKIAEYLQDREIKPIRIFLNSGGCGGPGLAMTLDEPKDKDTVFDIDGFQFIVDEDFLGEAAPIKVDFSHFGFQIDCAMEFQDGCSSCGTTSACG
ncbi:MAG: IscA/HesB family protein [Desulfobacteraceae bacterium]|nr:IscA/HesB family protein [Desulfobacteraceae bacterium]MDH3575718.1 IscA/HesB family protein [Desulfobacteraceae bacterium]MDH3722849.1 IscA/HesB family protein [Desulfobacteraceae bacterium]MDH3836532.1 IscA/HesB family protein [Desulfobacteraceae bacterium]MDH3881397.1 IscA/HesB family protein [Desulfobacteraceae bacterium]